MMLALFSHLAVIFQLCLHFFEKLKHHTLGNKDHSRKLFWAVLAVTDHASDVWGIVSPLVVSGSNDLVDSMDEVSFNCYLAAPRPTMGYYRGGNLTQPNSPQLPTIAHYYSLMDVAPLLQPCSGCSA